MMKELGDRETVEITQTPVPSGVPVKTVKIKTICAGIAGELSAEYLKFNKAKMADDFIFKIKIKLMVEKLCAFV